MAEEPKWGEDTVPLGASGAGPAQAEEGAIEAAPLTGAPEEEVGWGEDTVVLGSDDAAQAQAPMAPVGRREPAGRRPPVSVLAIGLAVLVVIAVSLLGGDDEQKPAPVAPIVEPGQVERQGDAAPMRNEDRLEREADRRRRSARLVRERRRAREHQLRERKAAKSKERSAADPSPVPEYAPEPEPEYVPEYTPEPVPEATPSPEAGPSPPASTPPAVEFGM